MTNDELIYAVCETMAQLEEYRTQILDRYRGKIFRAYGKKSFQVERVEIKHGSIWVCGSILKKDRTPHAKHEYGLPIGDI